MSDGMSDAKAENNLADDVWQSAFAFLKATAKLGRAIKRARLGHRGWSIARSFIVTETNQALFKTGFRLVDDDPEKCFEYYPEAYGTDADE